MLTKKNLFVSVLWIILICFISCSEKNNTTQHEKVIYNYDYDRDTQYYYAKLYKDIIQDAVLEILKTQESLTLDIEKIFPFIRCAVSKDGLVRTYSWDSHISTDDTIYTTIVQYVLPSGRPDAKLIDDIVAINDNSIPNPTTLCCQGVYVLKDNIYMLALNARAGAWEQLTSFITLELKSNGIVSYHAFNNETILSAFWRPANRPVEDIIECNLFYEDEKYKIKITYGTDENEIKNETLFFVFADKEFIGDYEKLETISGFYQF
jgi:hypothetical protein